MFLPVTITPSFSATTLTFAILPFLISPANTPTFVTPAPSTCEIFNVIFLTLPYLITPFLSSALLIFANRPK